MSNLFSSFYTHFYLLNNFNNIYSKEDAHIIFRDAGVLNMTEAGYIWIATEQALLANNTPDGVLGLQLVYANSEKEHIRVSVLVDVFKFQISSKRQLAKESLNVI